MALVLSLLAVAVAAAAPSPARSADRRPNIVLIVTDDQSPDSLPQDPPAMPYLQARMEDPRDHWISFPNAFLNTPLCCPSRASILTGRYSHHTGVRTNEDGHRLDESSTIATWLHAAGYHTGLVGKYVNGYPFGPGRYVPPGWDVWLSKKQGAQTSAYQRYTLIDQGLPAYHGDGPANYSTDVYADAAVSFVHDAPPDRPFFLTIATTAPHRPWTPALRHSAAAADIRIVESPSVGEEDVSDKPDWVRSLPPLDRDDLAQLHRFHRRSFETLRAVDELVAAVIAALEARGVLDRTVVLFLSDNGFSFGEHQWVGKTCAYEECIGTPFLVRYPGTLGRADERLVSNVDIAPTIADLAGVRPDPPADGLSLVPVLDGASGVPWRSGVLLEYVGDEKVPSWWAVRTSGFVYVELATGERELYDLAGVLGPPDPYQLENRAGDPAYAGITVRLAAALARLRAG